MTRIKFIFGLNAQLLKSFQHQVISLNRLYEATWSIQETAWHNRQTSVAFHAEAHDCGSLGKAGTMHSGPLAVEAQIAHDNYKEKDLADLRTWLHETLEMNDIQVMRVMGFVSRNKYRIQVQETLWPWLRRILTLGGSITGVRKMILKHPPVVPYLENYYILEKGLSERLDLKPVALARMIIAQPQTLLVPVDEILLKVQYFTGIGLKKSEVKYLVMTAPEALRMRLDTNLKPKIERYVQLGVPLDDILVILRKCPRILTRDFQEFVQVKIDWLKQMLYLNHQEATDCLVRKPELFMLGLQAWKKNLDIIKKGLQI